MKKIKLFALGSLLICLSAFIFVGCNKKTKTPAPPIVPVESVVNPVLLNRSYEVGQELSDITIALSSGDTAGTIAWKNKDYTMKLGQNTCDWIFIPSDVKKYKPAEGQLQIFGREKIYFKLLISNKNLVYGNSYSFDLRATDVPLDDNGGSVTGGDYNEYSITYCRYYDNSIVYEELGTYVPQESGEYLLIVKHNGEDFGSFDMDLRYWKETKGVSEDLAKKPMNATDSDSHYSVNVSITSTAYTGAETENCSILYDIDPKDSNEFELKINGWKYKSYDPIFNTPYIEDENGNRLDIAVEYSYSRGNVPVGVEELKDKGVGTYKVKAKIEDSNYTTRTIEENFEINKADRNCELSMESWTYGETANNWVLSPAIMGETISRNVTYLYKATNEWKADKPTEAGSYKVKVIIYGSTNYNDFEKSVDFEIYKAKIGVTDLTLANKEVKYTGSVPIITFDNIPENCSCVINDLTEVNVGVYNKTATITSNNNNYKVVTTDDTDGIVEKTFTLTIWADLPEITTMTYDAATGFTVEIDGLTKDTDYTLSWEYKANEGGTYVQATEFTADGYYKVTATGNGTTYRGTVSKEFIVSTEPVVTTASVASLTELEEALANANITTINLTAAIEVNKDLDLLNKTVNGSASLTINGDVTISNGTVNCHIVCDSGEIVLSSLTLVYIEVVGNVTLEISNSNFVSSEVIISDSTTNNNEIILTSCTLNDGEIDESKIDVTNATVTIE